MKYDVIVAGAGASGLLAAGSAAETGARVLLIEKMDAAGKKILITGNGRCNITNAAPIQDFFAQIFPNPRFLKHAFSEFNNRHIISLLEKYGVKTKIEDHGRILPTSNKAIDVRDALLQRLADLNVEIRYHCKLTNILFSKKAVEGIEIHYNEHSEFIGCYNLILCLGGNSYQATGSAGDGYHLAKKMGHSIQRIRPALVPLITSNASQSGLQGLSLTDVKVSVWCENKKITEKRGEMLFTHYGLSGPSVLLTSKKVVECLEEGKQVKISIDLEPEIDEKQLDIEIIEFINQHGKKKLENMLLRWIEPRLTAYFLLTLNLNGETKCHQINSANRKKIVNLIKNLNFDIIGTRSFKEAIITAGGIKLDEIDSHTMQSKIIHGLFFAGELIDLDGNTGGYNLQIAWSTGHLAGKSWNSPG